MSATDQIQKAAQAVKEADALLIAAGAGMGVDSGLPDFRGVQGFWNAYPVIAKLGLCFERMANPDWFQKDPHLAWAFYGHRLNLYRRTEPHEGFRQLLEVASRKPKGYFVFTSNVDGQFQKAGFDPERIVECHASIHHFQCSRPCGDRIWDAVGETVRIDEAAFRALEPLPTCKRCSAVARPNILMFDDWFWFSDRTDAQQGRFETWLNDLSQSSATLAVIELGAGTAIPTVRRSAESLSRKLHATLIRINPRDATVPVGQIGLSLGALAGVRAIIV